MNTHLTNEFLGRHLECACGRTHEVPSIRISIGSGALDGLPDAVKDLGPGGSTLLVADARTLEAAGNRARELLAGAGTIVETHIIEDEHPHADDRTVAAIRERVEGRTFLTACGAGTINDVTKCAATHAGIPYVCVPTAPSMNGYTSIIIAITENGVKTTTTGNPPVAIVADTDVVAACPHDMILAGLGDLLSKNVSGADWWLAHYIDGEYFCELPLRMVADVVSWAQRAAPALARGEARAVEELTEYLLVSGLSMTVAGISRPSSGGEHLISHLWDMRNLASGAPLALHGVQVGVGTVLTARLYDEILGIDAVDTGMIFAGYPDSAALKKDAAAYHGTLADAVWEEFKGKLPSKARLARIAKGWDTIRKALPRYTVPADTIEAILKAAGAATRPSDLGLDPQDAREAILHAREIRARYTVLDLAADVGVLEDAARNSS